MLQLTENKVDHSSNSPETESNWTMLKNDTKNNSISLDNFTQAKQKVNNIKYTNTYKCKKFSILTHATTFRNVIINDEKTLTMTGKSAYQVYVTRCQ